MVKTLAQKCYDSDNIEDELFEEVNRILGCPNFEKCNEPGFVWGAIDVFWDSYDESVEVVRNPGTPWMSREQADEILNLGFGQIYETVGDVAKQWTLTYCADVSATGRTDNEANQLRAKLNALLGK